MNFWPQGFHSDWRWDIEHQNLSNWRNNLPYFYMPVLQIFLSGILVSDFKDQIRWSPRCEAAHSTWSTISTHNSQNLALLLACTWSYWWKSYSYKSSCEIPGCLLQSERLYVTKLCFCLFFWFFLHLHTYRLEGSASDARVYHEAVDAVEDPLVIPLASYLLADGGYPHCRELLTPYHNTRYHLAEWGRVNLRQARIC